jgi:hypothetical protein
MPLAVWQLRLKDEGRVLMPINELREMLLLRLSGEFNRFADKEPRMRLTGEYA